MNRHLVAVMALGITVGTGQDFTAQFGLEDHHFSAFGGTSHFNLNPGHQLVLEGDDDGELVEMTITALNQTKAITLETGGRARAITARVIEEREVIDGELSEVGRFWYARSIETGDVYFFGEEVDFYSDGEIVGQALLWEAGRDGARPGMIMPRTFLLGARYFQNQAIAARDGAENIAMNLAVETPTGSFSNCVQIRETDFLRPENGPAVKTYAPGIGLVEDDEILRLTAFRLGTVGLPVDASFAAYSDHPFFPIVPGLLLVLEGTEDDRTTILTFTVLDEIRMIPVTIAGLEHIVPTRVTEERRTEDGELVEVSRKYIAQCLETGDVHYFGRQNDRYMNGTVVGHEGSWLAGVDGAEAGIIMPANLTTGARYRQQDAPGVASDLALNSGGGVSLAVPAGVFTNCLRITVTSVLDPIPVPREMTFAPGIGLVSDRNVLQLISFTIPGLATGAPTLTIQDAVVLTWPWVDDPVRPEYSPDLVHWVTLPQFPLAVDGRHQVSVPRNAAQGYFRLARP